MAKEKGKPVFSPIYKHFVIDDLAISAAYPIYDKSGVLKGVLGTHITFAKINRYLKEVLKDKKATAYIIEKNSGRLVANSLERPNFINLSNKKIRRFTIGEIADKSVRDAYGSYLKNMKKSFVVKEGNEQIHITISDYKKEGLDWLIITVIPESQFTTGMVKSIRFSIILSIISLIMAIIIYLKSTEIVLKPIYNLINAAEKFSKGDFLHRVEIMRNDETGKLSGAFNKMAEQLHMLVNNLEGKVKERTLELERTNMALKKSEGDIRLLLDSTAEAIYGIDKYCNCTFCNASCLKTLGYSNQDQLIGKNIHHLIHYRDLDGKAISLNECKIFKALTQGEGIHVDNEVFWRSDGTYFPVEYFSYPQFRDGQVVGAVITFIDITDRKRSQEEIIYLSYHDQLTNLYNRRYFEGELKRLDVARSLPLSIIMADMNGLKLVNDSLGHAVGDELIKKAAEVLKKGCRTLDILARWGGDEFIILLPKTKRSELGPIIKKIKNIAAKEKVESVELSISFGYATKESSEERIEDVFKKAEDHMYKNKLFESPSMRGKTINTIIKALCEKNSREEFHARRVSELCKIMGEVLNLPEGDIEELRNVGLLHDIGKIAIEESILNKPGKLKDEEWEEMKRHPEIGYRILSTVNDMSEMAEYVLAHHERWDGKGYPKGLQGTEIPLQSRIIAIADAYDAMTSERSYRNPLSEEIVIKELKENAGTQFDRNLIEIFINSVLEKTF